MERTFWVKQATEPVFPDLLWSRPESRHARGKLLVIGGNSFGFSAVGEAYKEAVTAGAGSVRVLMPEAIRKVVGTILEHAEYGTSNASGSFAQGALGEWLEHADWADGVLVVGDLGRNSETAILIEKFLQKTSVPLTITKDAVDYFVPLARTNMARDNITLVLSMAQLQKLAMALGSQQAFRLGMDLVQLVDALQGFSSKYGLEIVVKHLETICVAVDGRVSTTRLDEDKEFWRVHTAAHAAVWRLQNPAKPFEALTTSLVPIKKD